jgi:hypothetical protein
MSDACQRRLAIAASLASDRCSFPARPPLRIMLSARDSRIPGAQRIDISRALRRSRPVRWDLTRCITLRC